MFFISCLSDIICKGGTDHETEEKNILGALTELDDVVQGMRNKLRYGERLELDFEIKKK